jgi:adenylylsulfate kinase
VYRESSIRSLVKALSYRFIATALTALIVYLFVGKVALAVTIGALEASTKIFTFYLHERLWHWVKLGRRPFEPAVIWLTGLSGSGKGELAEALRAELLRRGCKVDTLDGKSIRELFPETRFTRADRDDHVKRAGLLASRLERNGVFVVASFVSPYAEARDFARRLCRRFVEVHVATPLETCMKRDPDHLYARALRGAVQHVAGLDEPYEPPAAPEHRVDLSDPAAIPAAVAAIMASLRAHF